MGHLLTLLHRPSDIYRVDEVLARTFNGLFVNLARSGFTLVVISVSTPAFIALIVPLSAMYIWIQRYYLRTSRELKRLDSVSKSPVYAHFQESLGGISTIRAYRQQPRFELENEWRVDANQRAYFPSISANRWLAIRLEFLGNIVILGAAGFAIVSVATRSGISAGMVGLAMSYALQITPSLNWIVRQTVEVETNIVSVERVLEYAALPSEAPEIIARNRPPASWPAQGAVQFHNYSTRYREGLDLVLKKINLDIKSHEKIGIVGRTGRGQVVADAGAVPHHRADHGAHQHRQHEHVYHRPCWTCAGDWPSSPRMPPSSRAPSGTISIRATSTTTPNCGASSVRVLHLPLSAASLAVTPPVLYRLFFKPHVHGRTQKGGHWRSSARGAPTAGRTAG